MFNFFNKLQKPETRSIESSAITNIFPVGSKGTQLGVTTSYACIRLLAQSVATVPIKHYKTTKDGDEIITNSKITNLLKKPRPNTTYHQWMNSMMTSLTSKGNAYSLIIRNNGVPIELIFIQAQNVSIYITLDSNLPYYYQITHQGKSFRVFPEDIIHFRNITIDNITGLSPISLHRITFDAAASISDYNKTFMDNATNISGVIKTDKTLNKDTIDEIRKNFGKKFGGATNAGQTPVLS
nr:phage portal protein [Mycoplasmatales bacterium]